MTQTPLTAESLIEHAEAEVLLNPVVKHDETDVANTAANVLQSYLMVIYYRSYIDQDKGDLFAAVLGFIRDGVDKPVSKMTAEEAAAEILETLDGSYEISTIEEFVEEFNDGYHWYNWTR